jgi:hypothetical protein
VWGVGSWFLVLSSSLSWVLVSLRIIAARQKRLSADFADYADYPDPKTKNTLTQRRKGAKAQAPQPTAFCFASCLLLSSSCLLLLPSASCLLLLPSAFCLLPPFPLPPYPFLTHIVVIARIFCTTVVLIGSRNSPPNSAVTSSNIASSTKNRSLPSGNR